MNASLYHTPVDKPLNAQQWNDIAKQRIYPQVFRSDFDAPGFALISFDERISSTALRSLMWSLKKALSDLHFQETGKYLVYLSMGRFDSQVTTKFHLDGAPDEAFLMLGYESSPVQSELAVADYARAAHDWGITPQELLADFNPMYANHAERLLPYVTPLSAFDPKKSHILLLNNSSLPYMKGKNMLGMMHQATTIPDSQARRIINSTMLTTALSSEELLDTETQQQFLQASEVTER